jgi:hypothetical protein
MIEKKSNFFSVRENSDLSTSSRSSFPTSHSARPSKDQNRLGKSQVHVSRQKQHQVVTQIQAGQKSQGTGKILRLVP